MRAARVFFFLFFFHLPPCVSPVLPALSIKTPSPARVSPPVRLPRPASHRSRRGANWRARRRRLVGCRARAARQMKQFTENAPPNGTRGRLEERTGERRTKRRRAGRQTPQWWVHCGAANRGQGMEGERPSLFPAGSGCGHRGPVTRCVHFCSPGLVAPLVSAYGRARVPVNWDLIVIRHKCTNGDGESNKHGRERPNSYGKKKRLHSEEAPLVKPPDNKDAICSPKPNYEARI